MGTGAGLNSLHLSYVRRNSGRSGTNWRRSCQKQHILGIKLLMRILKVLNVVSRLSAGSLRKPLPPHLLTKQGSPRCKCRLLVPSVL